MARTDKTDWNWRHLLALLGGNMILALGPWSVRLADTGPVSAGFWRLFLALPVLFALALANGQSLRLERRVMWAMAGGGLFFAADLASWHLGIARTKIANATLFGNSASLVLMVWAVVASRRLPRIGEAAAMISALAGAGLLMGRSLELGARSVAGDVLSVAAGLFYVVYLLLLQRERAKLGAWALLFWSTLFSVPVVLLCALGMGEPVWPGSAGGHWWPLLALALGSQVLGQGMLVYALRHFSPLMVGLALLTQPAIGVLSGWFAFGETLTLLDFAGIVLVSVALVLARLGPAVRP